ncbi:MAG: hypothetical protein EHM89_07745 [Acidobacteria bacterium]|nr:MAG: hypothetical protein EHM89_07745 [Acidobacteriota bacterium]
MRGIKFVAPLSAVLLLAAAQWSRADEIAHATVHVFVFVEPSISIYPTEPRMDLGSIQTGIISGQIPFRVESNGQTVLFSAASTPLFKGGVVANPSVPPIPIRIGSGIRIDAEQANPVGGANHVTQYNTAEGDVGGLPGLTTQSVEFESGQNGRFSQGVTLGVTWDQNDPEKPTGEYSGLVVLWAMVPPTELPTATTALASRHP